MLMFGRKIYFFKQIHIDYKLQYNYLIIGTYKTIVLKIEVIKMKKRNTEKIINCHKTVDKTNKTTPRILFHKKKTNISLIELKSNYKIHKTDWKPCRTLHYVY